MLKTLTNLDLQYIQWNFPINNILFSIFGFELIIYPKKEIRHLIFRLDTRYTYVKDFSFYNLYWKNLNFFFPVNVINHFNFQVIAPLQNCNLNRHESLTKLELAVIKQLFIKENYKPAFSIYSVFGQNYQYQPLNALKLADQYYNYFCFKLLIKYKFLFTLLLRVKLKFMSV